jgi:hypothetical protein
MVSARETGPPFPADRWLTHPPHVAFAGERLQRWRFLFSSTEGGAGVDEILVSKKWVVIVLVLIGPGAGVLCDVPQVLGCDKTNASAQ